MRDMIEILLVDDDKTFHLLFKSLCDKLDYNISITHAYTCNEAINTLSRHTFDLVVLDFLLGDGTAATILNEFEDLKNALVFTALPIESTKAISLDINSAYQTEQIEILPKSKLGLEFLALLIDPVFQQVNRTQTTAEDGQLINKQ